MLEGEITGSGVNLAGLIEQVAPHDHTVRPWCWLLISWLLLLLGLLPTQSHINGCRRKSQP